MSIWKNGKLIAGGRQTMPLLSFMWADHQLNDVSWLRADTFSWHTGNPTTGVYKAVYAHLADDIDGKTLQSETVSGITVQFYLADDGHKICPASEENNVLSIYNATGVAWYYIIDTANKKFKLPRESAGNKYHGKVIKTYKDGDKWARLYSDGWVEQGGIASDGNFLITMEDTSYSAMCSPFAQWAGNQNIGVFINRASVNNVTFSWGSTGNGNIQWRVAGWSVYVNDEIRANGNKYLYFYVGAFSHTAIENTAGLNAELFNGKADITSILPMVAPDYANAVTIQAGTTEQSYTCPSYGFVVVDLAGFNYGYCYLKINGVTMFNKTTNGNSSLMGATGQYMVSPGDVCVFKDGYANAEGFAGTCKFMFIPCKGVN